MGILDHSWNELLLSKNQLWRPLCRVNEYLVLMSWNPGMQPVISCENIYERIKGIADDTIHLSLENYSHNK